jgi:hypothetical protein
MRKYPLPGELCRMDDRIVDQIKYFLPQGVMPRSLYLCIGKKQSFRRRLGMRYIFLFGEHENSKTFSVEKKGIVEIEYANKTRGRKKT